MRIRRDDIDPTFVQQPLRIIQRHLSELTQNGSGRNLHQAANPIQPPNNLERRPYPLKTLRMRDYRDEPGTNEAFGEFLQPWRENPVRGLQKEIPRSIQRRNGPGFQLFGEIWGHVYVGTNEQVEGDSFARKGVAKPSDRKPNSVSVVFIEAGKHVRRAGHGRYAVRDRYSRHFHRGPDIRRSIIETREYM
jgi:hypothetical protein